MPLHLVSFNEQRLVKFSKDFTPSLVIRSESERSNSRRFLKLAKSFKSLSVTFLKVVLQALNINVVTNCARVEFAKTEKASCSRWPFILREFIPLYLFSTNFIRC